MFASSHRIRAVLLGALLAVGCSRSSSLETPPEALVTRDLVIESVQGAPTEAGGQARVGVRLNRAPQGTVTVKLSSSDETEATVSPGVLTFDANNWNAPQQVLITGVDDALADGAVPYAIVVTVSASDDAAFVGAATKRIPLTTTDDETAGVTVSAVSGATTEAGGKASFGVALNAQPSHDVQVAVSSSNANEGTASPAQLTFTPANWKAPQTVTVTGANDAVADGSKAYAVRLAFASADKAFAALAVREVALSNTDDDSAGFTLSPVSGATDEHGAQASFRIVLNSQPTGNVTLHLDSSDATEGSVSQKSLTFTAASWLAPQTVRVTGVNDDVADGSQPYAITFSATTGADTAYAGLVPPSVALSNTDDDSAGITVGAASGATTEAGGQATVSVVLNSEPTSDVTVHFDSSDASEGTVTQKSLTFTASNWSAPQDVLVTGANDDLADGSQPYALAFSATTSDDAAYAALTPANAALSNTDNDSAGITVSAASGATTEGGTQASFSVVLDSEPFADVTVSFDSSDATEGTLTTKSLTFTKANWKAPQAVQVTGANDDVADGSQPYAVAFTATQSEDAAYARLTPGDVALSNTDDDSAGITVSEASDATTEAGTQASFTVVLNSEPKADVTVSFDSSDATEGTLTTKSLTFTPANWKAPQTVDVTGVNDDVADGAQPYAVAFTATVSEDAAYAALTPANVGFRNTDDDSAGIRVSVVEGSSSETGAQAAVEIVLNSEPTADVTVSFTSSDPGEGTLTQGSVTFTPVNWKAPQTVLVTGVNDDLADGAQPYALAFSATTSEDAAYAALTPANAALSNTDNDSAGITVTPVSVTTTESGGQATVSIALTSEPFADVTVHFDSSDTTEGTVTPKSLTFTAANWKAPQELLITGVNDARADGSQPYALAFAATTSEDADYAALTPADVALSNTDDDSAGITVRFTSATTTEAGGQGSISVVLTSEPTADVAVNFDSGDTSEGTVAVNSLTFTAENWMSPQTILVTGVDDDVADGKQDYLLVFSSTTSEDAAYAALTPSYVALSNTDDDSAGFSVSAVSGSTTETGGQARFTLALTSQPFADVTLSFDSNDASEATLDTTQLTFTPENWRAPQEVVATGVNDDVADGNQPYAVVFGATTSADPAYAARRPGNVGLSNADDDSAGFIVSGPSGATTEAGGQATFSVALRSQPTSNVTVNFNSANTAEGTVSPKSLVFTAANWRTPQTATVTGVNDDRADGNRPYAMAFSTTTSADPGYAFLRPANFDLVNTDDDSAGIVVSAPSGATTESGGQATFSVVLTSQPFANVTVSFDSDDATEGSVAVKSLTFTSANWNVPQLGRVTGADDVVIDGNQPYAIVFSATTSSDAAYAALRPGNVSLTNNDNDVASFAVSAISGPTTETGGTATFTVALRTQPTADVTVSFDSSNTAEGTVSPTSITFTPATWNVARTVTVTGVPDGVVDVDQTYAIVFAATVSDDALYAAVRPANVTVVNKNTDFVPPAVGTVSYTGVISGARWKVCRADYSTAWLSADNAGSYDPRVACQSVGYSNVDAWGGTWGTVCGTNGQPVETYNQPLPVPAQIGSTVEWRCVR